MWARQAGYDIIEEGRVEFAPWITYDGEGVKE